MDSQLIQKECIGELLGEEDKTSVAVKEILERLVCSLYQVKLEIYVNEARYKLFRKKKKPPPSKSLPPTKDALYLLKERANYQYQWWKKALDHHPHLPHPVDHGWTDIDGSFSCSMGTFKTSLRFLS